MFCSNAIAAVRRSILKQHEFRNQKPSGVPCCRRGPVSGTSIPGLVGWEGKANRDARPSYPPFVNFIVGRPEVQKTDMTVVWDLKLIWTPRVVPLQGECASAGGKGERD